MEIMLGRSPFHFELTCCVYFGMGLVVCVEALHVFLISLLICMFACALQGHPQGGCDSCGSPKEDPQQRADDEGANEPDPVGGGLTFWPDPAHRGRRDKWTDGGGCVLNLIFPFRPPFFSRKSSTTLLPHPSVVTTAKTSKEQGGIFSKQEHDHLLALALTSLRLFILFYFLSFMFFSMIVFLKIL